MNFTLSSVRVLSSQCLQKVYRGGWFSSPTYKIAAPYPRGPWLMWHTVGQTAELFFNLRNKHSLYCQISIKCSDSGFCCTRSEGVIIQGSRGHRSRGRCWAGVSSVCTPSEAVQSGCVCALAFYSIPVLSFFSIDFLEIGFSQSSRDITSWEGH